jgi:hypothetical protein
VDCEIVPSVVVETGMGLFITYAYRFQVYRSAPMPSLVRIGELHVLYRSTFELC